MVYSSASSAMGPMRGANLLSYHSRPLIFTCSPHCAHQMPIKYADFQVTSASLKRGRPTCSCMAGCHRQL